MLKNEVLLNKVKSNNNPRYLRENFFYSLTELAKDRGNPLYARVIDPSNSNNIFSELMNSQAKQKIIQQAIRCFSIFNFRKNGRTLLKFGRIECEHTRTFANVIR